MFQRLTSSPVILGNVIKAILAVGVIFGLKTTEPDREIIATAVMALIAAWGVITKKQEYDKVTPMKKVENLASEIGGEATTLVDRIKGLVT